MSNLQLDVDQAGELKAAFRRGDWTNGEIKTLSEGDNLKLVRGVVIGQSRIVPVNPAYPKPLLEPLGSITVRTLSERLEVKKAIRVNTNEFAPVRISYVDESIGKWFGKSLIELKQESTLVRHRLTRYSRDFPILGQLDGKEESTWGEIYSLMLGQPHGPESGEGPLLVNGFANIFYVRDDNDELRAVGVFWRGGGWSVDAYSVTYRVGWDAGPHVFSRN